MIVAPFPATDSAEDPFTFVASTLTKTSSPRLSEYGEAVRVDKGIIHQVLLMIVLSLPSQFVISSEQVIPSPCLIVTVYEIIDAPFSLGDDQLIIMLVSLLVVYGVLGVSGAVAWSIAKVDDSLPYPIVLRASTVNSYVVPKVKPVTV